MKRVFINILSVALMAVALTACHVDSLDNPIVEEQQQADGSLVRVRMNVQIPDPIEVATRAVDPDGNGIQNMTLFCFDGEGLLISTANATLSPNTDSQGNILESGGIFDADIPNTTRVIHLLANQNMAQFKEDEFRNLSEDQVIANLEGSSGMMIYWARVEIPKNVVGNAGILQWITVMTNPAGQAYGTLNGENFPIVMLRNQAKVVVVAGETPDAQGRKWNGSYFQVSGFTVVNTQAFGTVAPYHTEYGYPTYACEVKDATNIENLEGNAGNWTFAPEFGLTTGSVANWRDTNYINAPRKSDKFSNITDVDTAPQTYVFETENSSADPVSVIIKGCNVVNGVAQAEKYYRVTLTDSEGEQVLVRRNHCYTVNIAGNLLYGVDSFSEALDAPATNNVWLSISDEIKSVQNGNFRLTVEKTSVVMDETQFNANGTTLTLNFNVDKLGDASISESDLKISWVDSNQDVSPTNVFAVGSNVNFAEGTGVGSISFPLYDFNTPANKDKDMLEGTILVKYGHLQRKIKVIIVRQQKFIPTWVTGQVYKEAGTGGTKIEASNATFVFTIPEDCPAELFPMRVLIATNDLDVRSETGQVLPIIRKGEEGYGEVRTDDIGYKYIYEVTEPGEQFVYLRSILNQETGASINITVEAEHFQTVTKPVVFTDNQRAITVTNVTSFVYVPGTDTDEEKNKESNKVYYVYLPQKQYAPWSIDLRMINLSDYADVSVNQYDEFLIYSKNLDAYADTEVNRVKELLPSDPWLSSSGYFPCQFTSYEADTWGTGGRVHAFMPRYTYWDWANDQASTELKSKFSIYMKTNKAKSAEVIRIASNQSEAQAVFGELASYDNVSLSDVYPKNTDGTLYKNKGTVSTYRSMIFELRNYPAFRFAAQVNGVPKYASGYKDLSDDEEENTPVQIDYQPGSEVRVAFDITSFMEEEDDGKVAEVDPFGSEFFVYIQTPDLELVEGQNGKIQAVDGTPGLYRYKVDNVRANESAGWTTQAIQSEKKAGERKEIRFRTKDSAIVTEGDIVIYTNQEQIGYKTKTFNVTNAPIAGTITYGAENSPVPADTFVSFSRELDGSRIGSLVVTSDGQYQLRLRKEYDFTWAQQGDSVKLYARINNGSVSKYYVATYPNLKALYDAPNIHLVEEKE